MAAAQSPPSDLFLSSRNLKQVLGRVGVNRYSSHRDRILGDKISLAFTPPFKRSEGRSGRC